MASDYGLWFLSKEVTVECPACDQTVTQQTKPFQYVGDLLDAIDVHECPEGIRVNERKK
jgi:hypothetical protein